MKSTKHAAKSKLGRPPKPERVANLSPHVLMLAEQVTEQLAQLSTTLEASISLDTAVAPEGPEDAVETFAPPEQIAAMRRSLKAEMRRRVSALGQSIDAIYACAAEMQLMSKPPRPPRGTEA